MDKSSKQSSGAAEGIFIIISVVLLTIAYQVLKRLYYYMKELFELAVDGMMNLADMIAFGFAIGLSGILVAIGIVAILDLLHPIKWLVRAKKRIRTAIAFCVYPTLYAYQTGISNSDTDRMLADILAREAYQICGEYPNSESYQGQSGEFEANKRRRMPILILGKHKEQIDAQIISPLYSEYLLGTNSQLNNLIDQTIKAKRRYSPVYFSGKLLHALALGKLGYGRGKGFKMESVEERKTDQDFMKPLLWCVFFQGLPDIEAHFRPVIHLEDRYEILEAEPEPEENPFEPSPITYLPSPEMIHDVYNVDEFPNNKEDEAEPFIEPIDHAEESIERVAKALSHFDLDNDEWNNPTLLLGTILSTLETVLPYYPDPEFLHERLAFVSACIQRLPYFEEEFELQMNSEYSEDEGWQATWMQQASLELGDDFLILSDTRQFRRICLRHYLIHSSETYTEAEKKITNNSPDNSGF